MLQSQTSVLKSQQVRIESNNDVIDKLKSELKQATDNMKTMKGKL